MAILINGQRYACQVCIRGHRTTSCQHKDRRLIAVRQKGRPRTQCEECRRKREVNNMHVKCDCKEKKKPVEPLKRASCKCGCGEACSCRSKMLRVENLLNPEPPCDDPACGCGPGDQPPPVKPPPVEPPPVSCCSTAPIPTSKCCGDQCMCSAFTDYGFMTGGACASGTACSCRAVSSRCCNP